MKRIRFLADERGMGAVEFAILSPVLALLVLGIVVGASYASQLIETRSAVQAGVKYVLQGGSNNTSIRAVALSAWAHKPTGGDVSVQRYCVCGDIVSDCAALCPASLKPPPAYIKINASASWSSLLTNYWYPSGRNVTQEQVIRVR